LKKLREKDRPAVNALGAASGLGPIVAREVKILERAETMSDGLPRVVKIFKRT
jgi:hypothetical protein